MAEISWESLRMLAGQTEVRRNVKKAQNIGWDVVGGQPADSGLRGQTQCQAESGSCLAQSGPS